MALRSAHGDGARFGTGGPRIEVRPADELPRGVPSDTDPAQLTAASEALRQGVGSSELSARGGKARGEVLRMRKLLGLWEPEESHPYAPYMRLAREWRDEHCAELADTVGGGKVGPGPASVVATAAIQMAASRWLSDLGAQTGNAKALLDASRLADSSRQNLLAAHELCAREAQARLERQKRLGGQVRSLAEALR